MYTNKDVIYQFKEISSKYLITDENILSDRWLYKEILDFRSRLIKQKDAQNVKVDEYNYQSICIPLEEIPADACPGVSISADCTVYRSKYLVPKGILDFKYLGNTLGSNNYSKVDLSTMKFKTKTRYSYLNDKSFYWIEDRGQGNHLYISSTNTQLTQVFGMNIFNDPLEAQTYPDKDGNIKFPCRSYYDYEFKIDESLLATIKEFIIKKFSLKYQLIEDKVNDQNPA